jgi:hypothetical protein
MAQKAVTVEMLPLISRLPGLRQEAHERRISAGVSNPMKGRRDSIAQRLKVSGGGTGGT